MNPKRGRGLLWGHGLLAFSDFSTYFYDLG